jgi:hypothetical protein
MRRLIFISIVCAFVTAPAMADYYGGQIYYNRIGGYYSGNGGEFTLSTDGGTGLLLDLSAYATTTKNQPGSTATPSFQSFCVEGTEYVASPMQIMVSTTTAEGTSDSHAVLGGKLNGDDLDPRTAYLYTEFATGTLTGYNYTLAGRAASAGDLQAAIWWIEGETSGVDNAYVTMANNAVAAGGEWYGMGIGNVRILNTWTPGHIGDLNFKLQDQLYLVPVPAAVLLGMLGLGVAGLKLRKFA